MGDESAVAYLKILGVAFVIVFLVGVGIGALAGGLFS